MKLEGSAWGGIGVTNFSAGAEVQITFGDVAAPFGGSLALDRGCLKSEFDLSVVFKVLATEAKRHGWGERLLQRAGDDLGVLKQRLNEQGAGTLWSLP